MKVENRGENLSARVYNGHTMKGFLMPLSALGFVAAIALLVPVQAQTQENRKLTVSASSYAAIAYSPATGKFAYAYDLRSRSAAEKAALEKCGEPDATIACWINRGFAALALGNDKSCWGAGWTFGDGANDTNAKDRALADCRKRTSGAHVVVALSSDGQVLWDYRDHTIITDKNGKVYDGYGNPITPTPAPDASASAHPSASPDKK